MNKRHIVLMLLAVVLPSHAAAASFTLRTVVDKSTPIPDGTGNFVCLGKYSISGSSVAFWGSGFLPPFSCRPSGIYRLDGATLRKVADANTAIPGGAGTFTEFGLAPFISGSKVVFEGFGSDGQHGIYVFDGTSLDKVVDTNTPIPGGSGRFSEFLNFSASGSNVAFFGSGSGQGGIYLFDGTTLTTVADRNTPIPPGGLGTFSGFGLVAISGSNVVFDASGDSFGQEGIYVFDGGALTRVADTSMLMPGGSGNFITFLSEVVISGSSVAFKALGPGFDEGIYVFDGTTLQKVVDISTPIPGGTGMFYDFGLPVIGDGDVSFVGVSKSQKEGLYLFDGSALRKVADARTVVPGGSGSFTEFFGKAMSDTQLAFGGFGSLGEQGIYFFNGTSLSPIADTDTPIPDGPGLFSGFSSPPVISDGHVAFAARGSSGQDGIYLATREPIGPAKVWLGLRDSDDVGLRLDIMAEVFKNNALVASGELDNQSAGSSGFNNALLGTVAMTPSAAASVLGPGDTVAIRVSARRTCSGGGHNAGTVRLWYVGAPIDDGKDRGAGTRFDGTIGGVDQDFFLGDSFRLEPVPGSSRRFADVFVDSKMPCPLRSFSPFGVWTVVLP